LIFTGKKVPLLDESRGLQLFFLKGVQSGLVWTTRILTDPFHDVKIYHKAPRYLLQGDMYDDMSDDWFGDGRVATCSRRK
jgi:hypothetical protein